MAAAAAPATGTRGGRGATRFFLRRPVRRDMLVRLALGLLGLVELLWPRRTVDFWMDLATANDEVVALRPWVYTAARVEGVLILAWVLAARRRT